MREPPWPPATSSPRWPPGRRPLPCRLSTGRTTTRRRRSPLTCSGPASMPAACNRLPRRRRRRRMPCGRAMSNNRAICRPSVDRPMVRRPESARPKQIRTPSPTQTDPLAAAPGRPGSIYGGAPAFEEPQRLPTGDASEKGEAARLVAQARVALDRGDLKAAQSLAQQAQDMNVPDNAFAGDETRPWQVLLEVEKFARRREGVMQASGANAPAEPKYPVAQGAYNPAADQSRVMQASNQSALVRQATPAGALVRACGCTTKGCKLSKHRIAKGLWRNSPKPGSSAINSIRPSCQQLKDKLTFLRAAAAQPLPAAGEAPSPLEQVNSQQEVLRQKLYREILAEEKKAQAAGPRRPEGGPGQPADAPRAGEHRRGRTCREEAAADDRRSDGHASSRRTSSRTRRPSRTTSRPTPSGLQVVRDQELTRRNAEQARPDGRAVQPAHGRTPLSRGRGDRDAGSRTRSAESGGGRRWSRNRAWRGISAEQYVDQGSRRKTAVHQPMDDVDAGLDCQCRRRRIRSSSMPRRGATSPSRAARCSATAKRHVARRNGDPEVALEDGRSQIRRAVRSAKCSTR